MKNLFNFCSSRSSKWTNVRKQHLKENDSCCGCGKKDKLEVHHIEPVHVNSNRELDPSNLVTLCKSCHFTIGHLMDWSSWNIDVVDDCGVYLNKVSNRPYKLNSQNLSFIQKIILKLGYKYGRISIITRK